MMTTYCILFAISFKIYNFEKLTPLIFVGVNECESDPCNGHRCVNKVIGYICQCSNGYTGKNCEMKPTTANTILVKTELHVQIHPTEIIRVLVKIVLRE